jgi:diacylglycerol kinase family enzyme
VDGDQRRAGRRREAGSAEAVLVTRPRVAGSRDLALARREMRRQGLAIITELDVGKAASLPELLESGGPGLVIAADEELEVTLDGEICDILPGDFEVAGDALPIITPLDFNDIDD